MPNLFFDSRFSTNALPLSIAARSHWLLIVFFAAGCERSSGASNETLFLSGARKTVERQVAPFFADDGEQSYTCCVVNDTNETISGLKLVASCSCTNVSLEKEELGPREQTLLHMRADPKYRSGPQSFHCDLFIDREHPPWEFTVRTAIRKRVTLFPGEVHFGVIEPNTQATAKVVLELYQSAGASWDGPTDGSFCAWPGDQIKTSIEEVGNEVQADGTTLMRIRLAFVLSPQSANGRFESSAMLHYVQDGVRKELNVPASWFVRNLYTVSPQRIFIGRRELDGGSIERRLTIRRTDGREFAITKIDSTFPSMNCSVTRQESADQHEIVINVPPLADQPDFLAGDLTIQTDHATQPGLVIPIAAAP